MSAVIHRRRWAGHNQETRTGGTSFVNLCFWNNIYWCESHVPIPGPNVLPSLHLHVVLHLCNHCNKCLCIRSRAASPWFHGTADKPTFLHRSITSLFYFRCECLFAWFSDLWHSPVLMSRLSVPSPSPFSQSYYIFFILWKSVNLLEWSSCFFCVYSVVTAIDIPFWMTSDSGSDNVNENCYWRWKWWPTKKKTIRRRRKCIINQHLPFGQCI